MTLSSLGGRRDHEGCSRRSSSSGGSKAEGSRFALESNSRCRSVRDDDGFVVRFGGNILL